MAAIDLPDDVFQTAVTEAKAAGMDVRQWVTLAVYTRSKGDLPFDDCGFPVNLPASSQETDHVSSASSVTS